MILPNFPAHPQHSTSSMASAALKTQGLRWKIHFSSSDELKFIRNPRKCLFQATNIQLETPHMGLGPLGDRWGLGSGRKMVIFFRAERID